MALVNVVDELRRNDSLLNLGAIANTTLETSIEGVSDLLDTDLTSLRI